MAGRRALRKPQGGFDPRAGSTVRSGVTDFSDFADLDDELVVGEGVALDLRPTAFVLRLAGVVIDYLVYFAVLIGLAILSTLANSHGLVDDSTAQALVIVSLVLALIVLPTVVETASHGKSLGKLAVGSRVVRMDGGAITLRHALIRALVGVLEIVMTTGGIAVIVGLLNTRSRRLGDLLAGTYALNERAPRVSRVVYGVPTVLEPWSRVVDVARLPDSLARRMSSFLQQAHALTPSSRVRVASALAAEASAFVSPLPESQPMRPPIDAETFIAGVAAVRRDRESRALDAEAANLARLAPALGGVPAGFPRR